MPTRHYTFDADPATALATVKSTALANGWSVDPAGSSPMLLALRRGPSKASYEWTADVRVTGADDGVTSLVAATDDMPHASDMAHATHDLDELFKAAGAQHH